MPRYACLVRNADGATSKETVTASSPSEAVEQLGGRGLHTLDIRVESKGGWGGRFRVRGRNVPAMDRIFCFRRLGMLLAHGISLSEALDGVQTETEHPQLAEVIGTLRTRVAGGSPLSVAMQAHPSLFSPVDIGLIEVGEESGTLPDVVEEVAEIGMRSLDLQSRLVSVFLYPVIVLIFSITVVVGFLVGVLPRFMEMILASEIQVPLLTRILMGASTLFLTAWPILLAGAGLGVWMFLQYRASPEGRMVLDRFLLRVPYFGGMLRMVTMARLTRTLGSLLRNGVRVERAMDVAGHVCDNAVIASALARARGKVVQGQAMTEALRETGVFPGMLLQMTHSGEMSGALASMLEEIGAFYDKEVTLQIRRLTTVLEPLMLILMGLLVMVMALSVMMPLFNLAKAYR